MRTTNARKQGLTFTALFCLAGLVGGAAFADGYRNPPPGAVGIGKVGGNIAHIDDASAVSINPANLTDVDATEAQLSVTVAYGSKELTPALGGPSIENDDQWSVLPSLFAVSPLGESGWTAGIGLTVPFGRFSEYDDTTLFRYSSPDFASLYVINLNPTVATRLNEQVSVAFGLDIYASELEFKQFYPWFSVTGSPLSPDGRAQFKGDGLGIGGHAAIAIDVTEKQRVAVTYKSPFDIDYEGDFDISNVPPGVPATPTSDFDSEIKFPTIVGLGYGLQVSDVLRVGLDAEWIEHSRNQTLPVDIANNSFLLPSTSIPQNWDDTWTFGAGFDYVCNDNWVVRGGYIYLESPQPSSTVIPVAAEGDQSVVSIGFGYHNDGHAIDFGYALGIIDDTDVLDNPDPTVNGSYEFEAHLFSVAYSKTL